MQLTLTLLAFLVLTYISRKCVKLRTHCDD